MKFILIGPTYPFRGGIAHYTTLLYDELIKEHSVKFISFKRQYPKFLFPGRTDREPSQGLVQINVEYLLDPFNPFTWSHVVKRIKSATPDIIIMQWWVLFWAPAWFVLVNGLQWQTTAKIVFLCHNIFPHEASFFDKWVVKAVLRLADGFVVHAEAEKIKILSLLPKAKVVVNPHPTYQVFQKVPQSLLPGQDQVGLKPGETVLLFFGFIRPYKGLDILLEALIHIPAKFPFKLLVVGEFWLPEAEIRQQVERLGLTDQVQFVNRYIHNDEIAQYFEVADLVVLPYRQATQSGVVQIAFGFGKPVVVTNVGGLAEVVRDGKTGFIVPPEDSQNLANAIKTFLQLNDVERETLHCNIRAEADKFSWKRMVRALIEAGE